MIQPDFLIAIVVVVLITSAFALGAIWIGGGRDALIAQRRNYLALVGGLAFVALIVGVAADADPWLTGLAVGLVSLVVALWLVGSQSGFPRALAIGAAALITLSLAFLILGNVSA